MNIPRLAELCLLFRPARMLAAALTMATAATMSALPAQAADDPPGRVGRVAEMQGRVWFYDGEPGEWIAAQRNRPVTAGDRLSVEQGGRAELRIGSTTVRLDGGTDFELRRLDDARIDMQLHQGSAALRVRSAEVAREIELATPEGRFLPVRTGHYRIDRHHDTSFATAWSGELRFESSDSTLAIPPGQRAELWQDGSDRRTHYSWSATERDAFSDWVARDNRDDERAEATRYVSPEMTGWEDLDRHGRWDRHPEYGTVWVPMAVAPGWAPYRYGHWSWVRPWGWTWIDDAPWGFAPFHYGRWAWWGGRWVWAPGHRTLRPVYSPALVAWIGGPDFNVSIGLGGAPVVGWVPLAPRDHYRPVYPVSPGYLRHVNPWTDRHPPRQTPGIVPTGPIMYGNRGVPGAVTVVPSQVVTARQPVQPAASRVDHVIVRRLLDLPPQAQAAVQAPPAPAPRVVAVPGGAVPAVPAPPGATPGSARTWPSPRGGGDASAPRAQEPVVQRPRPVPAVRAPQATPGAPAAPAAMPVPPRVIDLRREPPAESAPRARERADDRPSRERSDDRMRERPAMPPGTQAGPGQAAAPATVRPAPPAPPVPAMPAPVVRAVPPPATPPTVVTPAPQREPRRAGEDERPRQRDERPGGRPPQQQVN